MYAIPSLRGFLSSTQMVSFEPFYVRGTSINTYFKSGDSLYIGGNFTEIGKISDLKVNCFSVLNSTNASISGLIDLTLFDGTVNCHVISGSYIYVGGSFTTYNGVSCKRIAKISLIDGTADATFNSVGGFDNVVNCLAVDNTGSYLYVGGNFTLHGLTNTAATRIAKLNILTGALDATFSTASGFSAAVRTIVVNASNDYLFAGGAFTTYKSVTAGYLAKINATTAARDTTFSTGSAFNSTVNAIALDSTGNLFVGGNFTTYKSVTAAYLAKLNPTTAARDTTFSTTTASNGAINTIALDSTGNLFVGGNFTTYKSVNAAYLAKLNPTTAALDTTFDTTTGFSGAVNTLIVDNTGNLYVGGTFTTYKSVNNTLRLAKLNPTTAALDTTFDTTTGFNNTVNSLTVDNIGNLFVGGAFTNYKTTNITVLRNNIAKVSLTSGTIDTTFNPGSGFNAGVVSIAIDNTGNYIYVGGSFTSYNSLSPLYLAKLNATTAVLDTTFDTISGSFNNSVNAIVVDNTGNLYVGGLFTTYKSVNVGYLAKLNPITAARDTTFDTTTGFNNFIFALTMDNAGNLYVGGLFVTYKSVNAEYLAKLNPITAALDTTFDTTTGFNNTVNSLTVDNIGNLFVGGTFTKYKSVNNTLRLAKLNTTTAALDTTFNTTDAISAGSVRVLLLDGSNNLFVGGSFTTYKTISRQRLVKINATNAALDVSFDTSTGFDNTVVGLILDNFGNLLVSGFFNNYKDRFVSFGATINSTTAQLDSSYNDIFL